VVVAGRALGGPFNAPRSHQHRLGELDARASVGSGLQGKVQGNHWLVAIKVEVTEQGIVPRKLGTSFLEMAVGLLAEARQLVIFNPFESERLSVPVQPKLQAQQSFHPIGMQIHGYAAVASGLRRTQAHQTGTLHGVPARQGRGVGIGPVTIDIP